MPLICMRSAKGKALAILLMCTAFTSAEAEVAGFQAELKRQVQSSFPYNGTSCAACHMVPGLGGSSQVTVTRMQFVEPGNMSLPSRILHTNAEAPLPSKQTRTSQRITPSLAGDGLVEVIGDQQIQIMSGHQKEATGGKIHGQFVRVSALEASHPETAVGRFGWKAQHSSLRSSVADSMFNELGIPNPLYAGSGTVLQETSESLDKIIEFVRSLPPPERDQGLADTEDARQGENIFGRTGCSLCHVSTLKTLPPGTIINGGTYSVPEALGNRIIHPYSDFLLHDIGTGDGMIQSAAPEFADLTTANKFRTAPLWGLRYRSWMMHDGKCVTLHQAIMRHSGEASEVREKYERLTPAERHQLQQFLNSL